MRGIIYLNEEFTEAERQRLAPYFTNLDRPVFAVVNLPEAVKGALFARYSRYPGTLRRLFLDEFADDLPETPAIRHRAEGRRAAELYDRVFLGYGDDSVAQLGGAHVACEWVSNVLTKVLQRPRLGAYLEQSTRYIAYDQPLPGGGFRYYHAAELGPQYQATLNAIFTTYREALPRVAAHVAERFPYRGETSREAHDRAVRAKTFDLLRGLLPAASLSHMGIYASGQTYEQLILHLTSHPLSEARLYGEMMLTELRTIMPSFVKRLDRADRGGAWAGYLKTRRRTASRLSERLGLGGDGGEVEPYVELVEARGDERGLLAALLFEESQLSEADARRRVADLPTEAVAELLGELFGGRGNRRCRPGRGLESLQYRFEVVSDYGAFRDLQRHRMCTVQWQTLTPYLGADVPEELEAAGVADDYRHALELSRAEYERLRADDLEESAPYALCLAYRIRYVIDMNARAAMHLVELRSARQGHANYRRIAHAMHDLIGQHHPAVAQAMVHVDREATPRLERSVAEGSFAQPAAA